MPRPGGGSMSSMTIPPDRLKLSWSEVGGRLPTPCSLWGIRVEDRDMIIESCAWQSLSASVIVILLWSIASYQLLPGPIAWPRECMNVTTRNVIWSGDPCHVLTSPFRISGLDRKFDNNADEDCKAAQPSSLQASLLRHQGQSSQDPRT